MKKGKARSVFIGVCVLPAVILFFIFMIIPTINVFRMSLYKWGGYSNNKQFIGFDNFKTLMGDTNFLRSFQNTVLLIVIVTIITMALSLIFAAIISREKIKGENFFRIIFYMVMYMASMASVPESLYESADLEGAGKVQQFFSITLPLIWTNIRTTLSFFVISTINLSFQFVKVLTRGGPNGASDVFLSYMYDQAYTNSSYGYGMAIGVIVFLFSFGLAGLINVVTKREPLEF